MAPTREPIEILREIGRAGEGPHDIAEVGLLLAALDHPEQKLESYREHLSALGEAAKQAMAHIQSIAQMAHALCDVMSGSFGYEGDRLAYDHPRNADLMSVIDRRRGLPVALGILFIHAARAAGLEAAGLISPGHFTLSIAKDRQRSVIDPFACQVVEEGLARPPRMGALFQESVSDIDVLLRLENNLRLRAMQGGDTMRALDIARRMVVLGPGRPALWFDLAQTAEGIGALSAARGAYEACLEIVKPGQNLHNEAALALFTLKRKLN